MPDVPTQVITDIPTRSLCHDLLLPRLIEEKMLRLIRQGRISKWFSGYGQEAIAVGSTLALSDDDYILPMHRNLGVWTTRGVPLKPLFCQLMGKQGGFTKGRDRTFHFGLPDRRIIGMISHMAAMLPVACGLGQAARLGGEDFVALAFCGDGGSREGDFHEALNLAAVWKLPVVFVVENNGYGLSTPTHEAVAAEDIADAAMGYGMPGEVVDGNDLFGVMDAVQSAADYARNEGPVLLEMKTFRMRGHEEASGTAYVPDHLFEEWKERDPVERFLRQVRSSDWMDEEALDALRAQLTATVDEVAEWALEQPPVTSTRADERADLFAPVPAGPTDASEASADESAASKRFIDAISDGLREALATDDRVVLMGQDIAAYGGVFKVTEGFVDTFGPARVRNTPIIESGAIGAAFGLALEGYRPVVELQYADFITCGFNQTVNNLATTHYRWGQPVNVTLRMPFGGDVGAGPFHSQSMEAWFMHTPGLKVVVPSTPADARRLLQTALDDPNPVLFFEHKKLYRSVRGAVPNDPSPLPFGAARVARTGTDATIVTYGLAVHWALEEAEYQAAENGVELEVIDLRTLVPWDKATVRASLEKTNRLLVLHEATRTAGVGAELAAELSEVAFTALDAPPTRVAAEQLPVPFARPLEQDIFSAQAKLRPALDTLLRF
ncbi:alpha-ketoacid dehydrogenase subunit alpha/beta [Salisaeta longa]|uniref:alpha-ketoacid dehydrogenase subunit alpha/beta n=1 Tax=Salisaeta longa TaxID=503170 RepID=UPI0003B4B2F6|nr:dehydrogenase E1 component subunit alpha/beta [Salisaeta longa]